MQVMGLKTIIVSNTFTLKFEEHSLTRAAFNKRNMLQKGNN